MLRVDPVVDKANMAAEHRVAAEIQDRRWVS